MRVRHAEQALAGLIQERLRQDQQHNLRSLVLYALNEIGVYVEPEYLKPVRRRWTR